MSSPPDATKPLVSAAVVAARLGVSSKHVIRMARAKKIPSIPLGDKTIRFDLDKVLEELGVTQGIPR